MTETDRCCSSLQPEWMILRSGSVDAALDMAKPGVEATLARGVR